MLLQFNFSNHKTYLEENTLDLTATSIKEHTQNYSIIQNGEKCLKTIVIFGANGSGKTNVLDAFHTMKALVMESFSVTNKSLGFVDERFKYCTKGRTTPSLYEVFFTIEGIEYNYGFYFDSKKFTKEWLKKRDYRGINKYKEIFSRDNQVFKLDKIIEHLNESINVIKEDVLCLSFLANFKLKDINLVFKWFIKTDVLRYGEWKYEAYGERVLPDINFEDKNAKADFIDFLGAVDTGIIDIEIVRIDSESKKYKFYTLRKDYDTGKLVRLSFDDESSGTLKMVSMYSALKDAIDNGLTLFVDELDAKLHPLLTRYILNMFHDQTINDKNAQLIFTTHSTEILTKELFRRDQIYFSSKNSKGVSVLYSLVEFKLEGKKVRNDARYNIDYLTGRYGAIPHLKKYRNKNNGSNNTINFKKPDLTINCLEEQ